MRCRDDLSAALTGGVIVDASVTPALATFLGAATGGLTSVLATWLTHRTQARAQSLERDALRRYRTVSLSGKLKARNLLPGGRPASACGPEADVPRARRGVHKADWPSLPSLTAEAASH